MAVVYASPGWLSIRVFYLSPPTVFRSLELLSSTDGHRISFRVNDRHWI
jgi:hypothetical protein